MMSIAPHGLVAAFFVLSVLPVLPHRFRPRCQLAAHLFLAFFYLFMPALFLGITVTGSFNQLHGFLQSYVGAFHLGVAYYLYRTEKDIYEPAVTFSRASAAFFCIFTRLFAAWHLSEKSTRGLLITQEFIICSVLVDGMWFLTEIARLVLHKRTAQEEIDQLLKRTTVLLEEGRSVFIQNALWIDAFMSLMICLFHFSFPQQILKLVIKSEHQLDSHHFMWCRLFGALSLLPAVTSLQARYFDGATLVSYFAGRLVTQLVVFILNIYGHWMLLVYSPNHISAFMISGFYLSFLFSCYHRSKKHYDKINDPERSKTGRIEIKTIKKTI